MSVQQQEQPIGNAMWGGKPWAEKIGPDGQAVGHRTPQIPPGFVQALVSILLTIGGTATAAIGAGIAWGSGVGMFTGGIIAVGIGVFLGVSK